MTRAEHLEWAKERALAYLDAGDTSQAVASMVSDMRKHEPDDPDDPDTSLASHPALNARWVALVALGSPQEVRSWIEGFR